jgi:hypothetical protein
VVVLKGGEVWCGGGGVGGMSVGRHGLVGLHGTELMCSGRGGYFYENTQDDVSSCLMQDWDIMLQVNDRDNITDM